MAPLCSQSYQSFLRVSVVGRGLRQSQTEKKYRKEQSQKEIEPARIQVGGGTVSGAMQRRGIFATMAS